MLEVLTEDVIAVGEIKVVSDWKKLLTALMAGETITLIDGISKGVCASTQGGQRRSVQQSTTDV
ncbi:spore germination protein [Psychrobacillus sp. FSL K6-1267]|uniref:spore germination protein n=1 Tax=unclassified Psychrobacillus TaxID=2636677 RepID=UPI004046A6C2